jgi:transcriptional regulator with XRE-family HTH domain
MGQREELTRFLKTARGRISPEEAGLPHRDRRREKGLSRDEVAMLSGMSVTWYTWFEQGRDVQLSAPTLERLSAALKLDPREREFMFTLAQHRPPPLIDTHNLIVAPGVQYMMDSLTIPALVMTEEWTVIAWNRLVARVFRDYGAMPLEDRNLFKILLLNDSYKRYEQEYHDMVRRLTARLKWDYSRAIRVEVFDALIKEMMERSELFRQFWLNGDIMAHFEGPNTRLLPDLGEISFHHTSYAVEQEPSQRLMLFAPANAETAEKLRLILAEESAGSVPEAVD